MRVGTRALFIAAAAMVSAGRPALAQPAAPSAETQDVEEVVITATQRPSDIQNVPASVTVFSGAQLHNSGINDVKHLVSLSPSLGTLNSISESFGQLLRIRGVASSGADIGLESAAGITVDGVPLSRPNLAIADLQGLDRIEVLRGPQGTLFGKNATSGTINVLTLRPTFAPEYSGSVTGGNRGAGQIRMTANGALSGDVLAGRLDALYTTSDGYIENPTTGKSYGGREAEQLRGQLLYVPTAAFDLRLIADYFHHDGTINAPVYRVVGGPVGAAIAMLSGHALTAHFDAGDLTQIDDAKIGKAHV